MRSVSHTVVKETRAVLRRLLSTKALLNLSEAVVLGAVTVSDRITILAGGGLFTQQQFSSSWEANTERVKMVLCSQR